MKSSHIANHSYDPATQSLKITFHNGSTYRYDDVPVSKIDGMKNAPSIGEYFHAVIKNFHKTTKEK